MAEGTFVYGCGSALPVFAGMAYVYALGDKVGTPVIQADELIINEKVKQNKEVDPGGG